MDKIREAYERACIEGRFLRDSYTSFTRGEDGEYKDILLHSIVFTAYDGYHLGCYVNSAKEADKIVSELNSLHSIEKVDEYFKKLRGRGM